MGNLSIELSHSYITTDDLLTAVNNTNLKLENMTKRTKMLKLDIFKVIDFRNLSGLIGELFAKELSLININLRNNPYINGYPDLLQVANHEMISYFETCVANNSIVELINYKYGGVEVKNTFGTKKAKSNILMGDQRRFNISKKLDWKAHHQKTNNLIGLLSDYVDDCPRIVALCYSDSLVTPDWTEKQNPKEGSTMTSFCTISKSGYQKMLHGLKLCLDNEAYLEFFAGGKTK
jgi:hypothetical protein